MSAKSACLCIFHAPTECSPLFLSTFRPLVPSTEAADMTHQDSGLRISTGRGKQGAGVGAGVGVSRESLDGQPGSEAFYSPSASHDASPQSEPVVA